MAKNAIALCEESESRFVGPGFLAARWLCSRSTAVRYLSEAGVPAFFLGARKKSLRRYRLADVLRFEQRAATGTSHDRE